MPVDVQLPSTLPPYDADKVWEEFDWTPPNNQDQERKPYLSTFLIIRYLGPTYPKRLNSKNL